MRTKITIVLLSLLCCGLLLALIRAHRSNASEDAEIAKLGRFSIDDPNSATYSARDWQTIDQMLSRPIDHFKCSNMPLEDVFDLLRQKTGLNIVVMWHDLAAGGINADENITLEMNQAPLATVLDSLCAEAGTSTVRLNYEAGPRYIRVSLGDYLRNDTITMLYDVRDLLAMMNRSRGLPATSDDPSPLDDVSENLVKIIENMIDPSSWRDNNGGNGSIQSISGMLLVTQIPANQHRVGIFLDRLRQTFQAPATQPVMLMVDTPFEMGPFSIASTQPASDSTLITCMYDVRDLCGWTGMCDAEMLAHCVPDVAARTEGDTARHYAAVGFQGRLIITTTIANQRTIERFLATLRENSNHPATAPVR